MAVHRKRDLSSSCSWHQKRRSTFRKSLVINTLTNQLSIIGIILTHMESGLRYKDQNFLSIKSQFCTQVFCRRDSILYALGIGAEELSFVYENDPNFAVFPTYPAALVMKGTNTDVFPFAPTAGLPGLKFNP